MRRILAAAAAVGAMLLASLAVAGDALDDLRSADPSARARGRAALEAEAGEVLLLRALEAPEGPVREAGASVVEAAPLRATPRVREALRTLLRDGRADRAPRAAAARALGAAKDAGSAADIREALGDFPAEAALALASLGDASAIPDLRRVREADGDAVCPEVGYALAALGDPSGEDLLLARLGGTDPAAASAALLLLRRLTGRDLGPSVPLWTDAVRLRRLGAALGDRDWEASERALSSVLERGPAAGADLLAVFRDGGAPREGRAKAALGLGLLRTEEAGPALLEASKPGQDPYLRVYAVEALGRIAWAPAAAALARMLVDDEDMEVAKSFYDSQVPFVEIQGTTIRALLAMGADGALGAAVDQVSKGRVGVLPTALVSDFKVRVLYEALAILRDYGGPGAKDVFGFQPEAPEGERAAAGGHAAAWWRGRPRDLAVPDRARWSDPLFTAAVAREIRILGAYKFLEMDRSRRALILLGRPAVPALCAALSADAASDPSGQTRIGAAQVLASIGRPEAVPAVRGALARAESGPLRSHLLLALAALGPPGGIPEAVRMLGAPAADERAAAVEALALSPTAGAGPPLAEALRRAGEDPPLRIAAAGALLGLRDASAVEVLLGYLGDPDVILRRRAWEVLDRWVEGMGPFDPAEGTGVDVVRSRWEAGKASPRFRERSVPGR